MVIRLLICRIGCSSGGSSRRGGSCSEGLGCIAMFGGGGRRQTACGYAFTIKKVAADRFELIIGEFGGRQLHCEWHGGCTAVRSPAASNHRLFRVAVSV